MYKKHTSGFEKWDQKHHAEEYLLFPENLGETASLDETTFTYDELYTILTNKQGRAKNGSLVAMVHGTASKDIVSVFSKIPLEQREKVKEVTIDMARNMESAAKQLFTNAKIVTDRFHVVKLLLEVLQRVRVRYRWEAIDLENEAIRLAKINGIKYVPIVLQNGDTIKELLARSRFLLFRNQAKWTDCQKERALILFKNYPIIKQFYHFVLKFRNIYENINKAHARFELKKWLDEAKCNAIPELSSFVNTIKYNFEKILNFFDNRNTNAFAESFNSKIKHFRANLRGVKNMDFFLFRLTKLFA